MILTQVSCCNALTTTQYAIIIRREKVLMVVCPRHILPLDTIMSKP